MRKIFTKTCKYCGNTFLTYDSGKIYDTLSCQLDDKPIVIPENRHTNIRKVINSNLPKKVCDCCLKEFQPYSNGQKYCENCKDLVRKAVIRLSNNNKRKSGGNYDYIKGSYKDYDPVVEEYVRTRWVSRKHKVLKGETNDSD